MQEQMTSIDPCNRPHLVRKDLVIIVVCNKQEKASDFRGFLNYNKPLVLFLLTTAIQK